MATRPVLAPLQRRMLQDSLADPEEGHHVEQAEIRFVAGVAVDRILSAWQATVAATEALRIAFCLPGLDTWHPVVPPPTELARIRPPVWRRWLDEDRRRPLLEPDRVPWRTIFWPPERRFVWTFHHALLDGRSITRILHAFLSRVGEGDPGALTISRWQPPSPAAIAEAEALFRKFPVTFNTRPLAPSFEPPQAAIRHFGRGYSENLRSRCEAFGVTAATALLWCWGQALAQAQGTSSVWLEQIRCGAPQPASAGFTMNTLPLAVSRPNEGSAVAALQEFRDRLLELRAIETVSPTDFIVDGVYPDLEGPETSVVMIEHASLNHQLAGFADRVESLQLHEADGYSLAAAAYIAPNLQLRVDGPENEKLLHAWCEALVALDKAMSRPADLSAGSG